MPPQISSKVFVSLHIVFSIFQCCRVASEVKQSCNNSTAIIDTSSCISREEKIATANPTQELGKVLRNKRNLDLHVNNSSGNLLQASTAAEYVKTQMVIGLPGAQAFEEFVRCGEIPTGYCIDVFKAAVGKLGFNLSYKFECFNGTYNQLVEQVYYHILDRVQLGELLQSTEGVLLVDNLLRAYTKSTGDPVFGRNTRMPKRRYDAAVGDITIMANRSNYVNFTQPYMESSLTMVAPVKVEKHTWLFVKPFTAMAWLLIFSGFLYTMFVVWILERRSNPDFNGSPMHQLSTALWFTFCTLFFVHRESIRSTYTRGVMLVWFCAVFVIATSYQASLTTMLTLQHLKPTVTDIQQLKSSNATVGCDRNAFYRKYVEDTLGFHPENIISITSHLDYLTALKNGTVAAAFLELPYARVFVSQDSKHYKDTGGQRGRFGGFGFAFPLRSALAGEFSKAFLALSEDGTLKKLDEKWFPPNSVDSRSESNIEEQRLDHNNFTGLFLVTGSTSTVILVFYFILGLRRRPLVDPVNTGQLRDASDETNSPSSRNFNRLMSLDAESLNEFYTPGREIQMQDTYAEVRDNHTRPLRQATSFPGPDRRASGVLTQ